MKQLLSNIVLFCGGVNVEFLRKNCPDDRHKFYPIGLGVIITSLLGFISMMFASHAIFATSSFGDEIVLIFFSLFWAFAIFTIDWGLIKTMRKRTEDEDIPFWKQVLSVTVIFRLTVAIILSLSISRPLEVKIYEQRLKAQIEKDRQDFVNREWETRNRKIITIEEKLGQINAQDTVLINKKNEGPTSLSYKANVTNKSNCEVEYNNLKSINTRDINTKNAEIINIYNSPNSYFYVDSTNEKKMYPNLKIRITALSKEILLLQNEIVDKKNECESLGIQIAKEDSAYRADFYPLLKANDENRKNNIIEKANKQYEDSLALIKIEKASYSSFNPEHPGLITQLESMSNFEKTDEGKSASIVRLILLLLIICIDTAPIVIKLLTKRGVYELMQDADEQRMQFLTNQEGRSNNHLITQLSLAQKEILTEAIKRWCNKEKNREGMENDYLNSNQHDNGNENS